MAVSALRTKNSKEITLQKGPFVDAHLVMLVTMVQDKGQKAVSDAQVFKY